MRCQALIIALVLASGGIARAQRTGRTPAEADTERCRHLLEDRDYARGEQACMAALRSDASYSAAWHLYLTILIAEHKEEKAIDEATRAEETLGIRDPSVLALHGAAILQAASRPAVDPQTQQPNKWAKQHARALPYLERAVARNSKEYVAQPLLCTYWTLDPKYMDRSEAACQSALRENPNNVDLLLSQAWIHHNHKRHAEAQTIAEQALRLAPKSRITRNQLAAMLLIGLSQAERGDCDNARRTLEALQKVPGTGELVERDLALCAPHDAK